jgi:dipeptidyl-peptidase 4
MHKIILIVLLLAAQFVFAQQQQMTLEDAVLGRSTYLKPETLIGLAWKNDRVFTWEEKGAIMAEDAKKEVKTTLLTIQDANVILKQEADNQIRSFSGYSWTENEELLLQHGSRYFALDIEEKKVVWKISVPAEAENAVFK